MERKWQAVNGDKVKQAVEAEDFIHREKVEDGVPIYTFRKPGEFLEGKLVRICPAKSRGDRQGYAVLEYPAMNGETNRIAVRASKWLRDAFKQPGVYRSWIRITYEGERPTKFGHAQKIYLVQVDKGFFTPKLQEVKNNGHSQRNKEARKRRPIARPNGGKRLSATA